VVNLFGTDFTASRSIVRGLLDGRHRTCLLYSEPGAGSDLAAVQTRAERDHDEWVVNGQKVWSSLAAEATLGLLVARTDWDVPKHKGLTLFLMPMDQPGVDVRPIKQMTGRATFNEVFLSDARVAETHRIGDVNGGWAVLQTALALERMAMGNGSVQDRDEGSELVRTSVDTLVALARERGRNADADVRQDIARLYALERAAQWNGQRAEDPTDERAASVVKLAMSEILHGTARLHTKLLGAEGMLAGDDSPSAHHAHLAAMCAFENSIGGGSDQIQRNLIGERLLGLPREPSVDRDVPFREVRKSAATWR